MDMAYTGGCACGAVRYRVEDVPAVENHCQCRDCQRRSGTGHSSYLTFLDRSKTTVTGHPSAWRVTGDSGNDKIHSFCAICGTPVYLTFSGMPDLFAVHPGSLDEPERFKPQLVTYAKGALDWDAVDPDIARFTRMP